MVVRALNRMSYQVRAFASKFDFLGSQPIPATKQRLVPTTGSYPNGFTVGSIRAGIKPANNPQPDLVIMTSDRPASSAAVFTRNEFCAASITVSREVLRRTEGRGARGIIANSGCANTLTGQEGLDDAMAMGREAAKHIPGPPTDGDSPSFMVMHTGTGAQR